MRKIYILLPILFLFVNCKNNDLVIQKSKKNCSCGEKLDVAEGEYYNFCIDFIKSCNDDPFYLFGNESTDDYYSKRKINNNKIFSKTNSMELINNSKTKVYKATIQIDNDGKISYQEYTIEPTATLLLGCDRDFIVRVDQSVDIRSGGDCYDALELSYLSKYKIEYNKHKVELVSEY